MEDQLAELTDAPGGHEGGESENPEDDMEVKLPVKEVSMDLQFQRCMRP